MWELNLKRLFLKILIASVAVSALFGIAVVLLGNFGEFEVRVLMTTLTITVTSILGLACGASIEAGRSRTVPMAGIAFSIASALALFLIIWNVLDDSELFIKSTLTLVLVAVVLSHISLISLARLDRRFAWSLTLLAICDILLAGILLYIMWFEPESSGDLVYRVIAVLSILIAAFTVMTPVFHKISSSEDDDIAGLDAEIEQLENKLESLRQRRSEAVGRLKSPHKE
jgi:hypothetical protein